MDTFIRWPTELARMEAEASGDFAPPVDDRDELLRLARYYLERVTRYERWGPLAIEDAMTAGELLRRAGLPDLAAECEDEFGIDVPAVIADLEHWL